MTATVVRLDPLFDDPAHAARMVDLCERLGRYRMYAEHEQLDTDIGHGLAQRHDAVTNFLRTGGLAGACSTTTFRGRESPGRRPGVRSP